MDVPLSVVQDRDPKGVVIVIVVFVDVVIVYIIVLIYYCDYIFFIF